MKRAYMFNMDDFIRIGGTYEFIEKTSVSKDYTTCIYRLSYKGKESPADVDVFKNGARMVSFRDDADYALFEAVQEGRLSALKNNDTAISTRNFLNVARYTMMAICVVMIVLSVFIIGFTGKLHGPWIPGIVLSIVLLAVLYLLYRCKTMIWGLMNVEHDDDVKIERSVPHEGVK